MARTGARRDPHRRTLDAYETGAAAWDARRGPPEPGPASDFARAVATGRSDGTIPAGAVADLGCGPGRHLDLLPGGTIAVDGASSMLELARAGKPGAPLVQADLRALPFARHGLAAAWASKSYVHLRRDLVPLALWDLHRSLAVGAIADLLLFGGDAEQTTFADDDIPGRSYSLWPDELLAAVVAGAGFSVLQHRRREPRRARDLPVISLRLRRERTLADTVGPGMRLLLVGLNPSLNAADTGVGFSGPGNRGWPALAAAGLAGEWRDPRLLLEQSGVGMTDLVKRATARAAEVSGAEFRDGIGRLDLLCGWLRPGAVCVVGLTGWRHAIDPRARPGLQQRDLGGRPVWLMPNPSGLNAGTPLAELAEHLVAATRVADSA